MKQELLRLFAEHPQSALLISIFINIIIALAGIIPSFFITAANILFFGFWEGTLISFIGESTGAVLAFLLYRWGFKKAASEKIQRFPKAARLLEAGPREAFGLIFSLRLLPFVPSGLVTFAAAIGRVSFFIFFAASSLGKVPALLMEAWSVYQVTAFNWQGKVILVVVAVFLLWKVVRKAGKSV